MLMSSTLATVGWKFTPSTPAHLGFIRREIAVRVTGQN
jgi:hypothetical protein